MEIKIKIGGIICLALSFVVMHYLNKDYNLNGGKRILSSSRYGRIAYWSSLFMLILFTNLGYTFLTICAQVFPELGWINKWLAWLISALLGFIFVGSVYLTTYAGYKTRKREDIKDDKNDV